MNKEILAMKDNPITCAAALVAATLLYDPTNFLKFLYLKDGKFYFIEPLKENSQEKVFDLKNEKNEKVIFVSENDLEKYLFKMREEEFNGAVLIFSTKDFSSLKKEYPILLKAARGSHKAFKYPYSIFDLLGKIDSLQSVLEGNMTHLKSRINEIREAFLNDKDLKQFEEEITKLKSQSRYSKQNINDLWIKIINKYPFTSHDFNFKISKLINDEDNNIEEIDQEFNKFLTQLKNQFKDVPKGFII